MRVDVDTASADTEVPELDDALKDEDFFDVKPNGPRPRSRANP